MIQKKNARVVQGEGGKKKKKRQDDGKKKRKEKKNEGLANRSGKATRPLV